MEGKRTIQIVPSSARTKASICYGTCVFLATLMPKHTSFGAIELFRQHFSNMSILFLARRCKGPFCMLQQQCRLKVKVCGGVLRPLEICGECNIPFYKIQSWRPWTLWIEMCSRQVCQRIEVLKFQQLV